ncbi:MAG: ATP synthase subunit C [Candidatus Heimdallarchaeota archaeon]
MMQVIVIAVGLLTVVKIALAFTGESGIAIVTKGVPGFDPISILAAEDQAGLIAIGAGLAIGIAGAGAGIGLGTAAASAAAAITEKPESFGKLLVLLALIEAIAIYGFVIAFVLSGNIA